MDKLYDIYYDPKTGFGSALKLYLKLNKEVPMSQIKNFLEQQEVYQVHKERRKQPSYSPIMVYSVNDQWQIHLIDLSKYSRWNAGYKYLVVLCGIDVFSRKYLLLLVAIKRKSNTTDAILDVQTPILIQSDNGTEFLNNNFQRLLTKDVRHITVNVGDHNRQVLIERFNRTLEPMFAFYQESRKTNRYVDLLEDIVHNYNHTYHGGIGDTPESRYQKNPSSGSTKVKTIDYSIRVGCRVRILIKKQAFHKKYEPTYSKNVYTRE
jgi:transposase InsO family protein